MARNDLQLTSRWRNRRTHSALTAPEWLDAIRDFGLMLSGIYQDLRGDMSESWTDFTKWVRAGARKMFGRHV